YMMLRIYALDDRFDDQATVFQRIQTIRGFEAVRGGVGMEPAFLDLPLNRMRHIRLGTRQRPGVIVDQDDRMPVRQGDLGDAGPHGTGAEHANDLHWRYFPVNVGARFSWKARTPSL